MAGSGLPAIRNGYQQPSGDHANGRGLPNDDIRRRVTGIRCCGNENRFSTLTISAVGDREIRAAKIGTRPASGIPEQTGSRNGCYANQTGYQTGYQSGSARQLRLAGIIAIA